MTKLPIKSTILLISLFSIGLFYFMAIQQDSSSFVEAIYILGGDLHHQDRLWRLTKPLALVFPSFLRLFGCPILYGLWLQQLFSYWLMAVVFYAILGLIYPHKQQAYIGLVALLLCQPMAVYGLAILVDTLGWAAILAVVYYSIKQHKKLHQTKLLIRLGIALGLGFFIKESILVAGLFIFYLILLLPLTWRAKIKAFSWIGLSFLIVILLGSGLTWVLWQQTVYHWFLFNENSPPVFNIYYLIQQTYRCLDVYWFLVLMGIYQYIKTAKHNIFLGIFLLTALSAWLLFPMAWHYHYDRILFMNALFLIPFVPLATAFMGKWQLPFVGLMGTLNLLVAFGIYKYQIGGLIVAEFFIFCFFLALFSLKNYQIVKNEAGNN